MSIRPPSWKRLGWRDAPNAPTPAQVAAAMVAPVANRPTQPDTLRSYAVGVCTVRGRIVAYTSDRYLGADGGYCLHHVSGTSGGEAKTAAIAAHQRCAR